MLDIDPKNVDALNNKGLALDSLGNHRGAIAYFDKLYVLFGNQVNNMTAMEMRPISTQMLQTIHSHSDCLWSRGFNKDVL